MTTAGVRHAVVRPVLHPCYQRSVLGAQPGDLGRRVRDGRGHAGAPSVSSRTRATSPATEKGLAR